MKLPKIIRTTVNFVSDHSNAILTGISVVSTISAVYFAIKDAPRCKEMLEELEAEGATNKQKAKAVVKTMARTGVATVISVATTIANGRLNGKKIDSLLMKYQMASSAKELYQMTTREIAGDEIADKIDEKVARHSIDNPNMSFHETGDGTDRIKFDFGFGIMAYSDIAHIKSLGVDFKDRIINGDEVLLVSEVLQEMNLPSRWYDVAEHKLGWHPDWFGQYRTENFFDFHAALDDDDKAYTIVKFAVEPKQLGRVNSPRYRM